MCGCGLSDTDMAALSERLPDLHFVWEVSFGKWKLRTDSTAFSTLNSNDSQRFTSADFAPEYYRESQAERVRRERESKAVVHD